MSAVTHDDSAHAHHPFLQHHFEDLGQQHEASTLGMWMFLTTEILFFGGVLCAYWVYRVMYPEAWALGAHQQNTLFGGINTIVLIISSLTMALAVRNAQLGRRSGIITMLVLTLIFGSTFLGIKAYEYHAHFTEGLFPGAYWHWNENPVLAPKVQLFTMFYWTMTGLHAPYRRSASSTTWCARRPRTPRSSSAWPLAARASRCVTPTMGGTWRPISRIRCWP